MSGDTTDNFRKQVQAEAKEALLKHNYGSVDISMRLGKSLLGLNIAENFDSVLVSYPNTPILNSWVSDAEKFNKDISNIEFTTHLSLVKKDLSKYKLLIIDEGQLMSVNQYNYVLANLPEKVYMLTGTIPNSGDKKSIINKYFPIRYTKKLSETTGITNKDYTITVHLLEPDKKNNIKLKSGKMWSESSKIKFFDNKYTETNDFRFMIQLIQVIAYSKTKLNYFKKLADSLERCILFVETMKQCKELKFPTYHTKESKSLQNLEDFIAGKIDKLSSISQLQSGITIPNVNKCIILHSYSSNAKSQQKIGRILNINGEEKAEVHILALKGTRDEKWVMNALQDFDKSKIIYKYVDKI